MTCGKTALEEGSSKNELTLTDINWDLRDTVLQMSDYRLLD